MNINEIKKLIEEPDYDFIRKNPELGSNIILLGLGGSHAYGTNIETSDIDLRGIAARTAPNILTGQDFEQVVNTATDTTIYSVEKIFRLLAACNPNTIEMLGLKPDHYIILTDAGRKILDNRDIFLSKRALYSFAGYAMAQLNRLNNKADRVIESSEQNETRSLQKAISALIRDGVVDEMTSVSEEDGKIYVHLLGKYKIDNFAKLAQNVLNVHSDYQKSKRNDYAAHKDKLSKHQMHLVRLLFMARDILENGEIITYREKEHDLLMDIRAGKYLINGTVPTKEFMDMVAELNQNLEVAGQNTYLPDRPDEKAINKLLAEINAEVIKESFGKTQRNSRMSKGFEIR